MLNKFYDSAARRNYNTGVHQNLANHLLDGYVTTGLTDEPKVWRFLKSFNYTTIMMNSNQSSHNHTTYPQIDTFKFHNQNKEFFLICTGTGYEVVSLEYTLPYVFEISGRKEAQFLSPPQIGVVNLGNYYLIIKKENPPQKLIEKIQTLFNKFPYPERKVLFGLIDATNHHLFCSTEKPNSVFISNPYNSKILSNKAGNIIKEVLSGNTNVNEKRLIEDIINKELFDETVQTITEITNAYGHRNHSQTQ